MRLHHVCILYTYMRHKLNCNGYLLPTRTNVHVISGIFKQSFYFHKHNVEHGNGSNAFRVHFTHLILFYFRIQKKKIFIQMHFTVVHNEIRFPLGDSTMDFELESLIWNKHVKCSTTP